MEHHLAKVGAAGSNPVSRFFYYSGKLGIISFSLFLYMLQIVDRNCKLFDCFLFL